MDPATVAAFYRAKGYAVRDNVRVPGLSGNEHRVPLLAEGPLGSLAVFFGDFGGVDGPEMGGARKAARDIGATPVLAADAFSNQDRQVAARLGVVLLDGSMMQEDEARPPAGALGASVPGDAAPSQAAWPGFNVGRKPGAARASPEAEAHPWPASGRVGGRDGAPTGAVDIDDLLADTRPRSPAMAEPEPSVPSAPEPAPAPRPHPSSSSSSPAPATAAEDALWRKPRRAAAAATATDASAMAEPKPSPRRPKRFGWLAGDANAVLASSADEGQGQVQAAGYDAVVAARRSAEEPSPPSSPSSPSSSMPPGAGAPEPGTDAGPGDRLGESIELKPTLEEAEHRRRRDRLQRRVFWVLFAFVFVYLFWLFWTNKL